MRTICTAGTINCFLSFPRFRFGVFPLPFFPRGRRAVPSTLHHFYRATIDRSLSGSFSVDDRSIPRNRIQEERAISCPNKLFWPNFRSFHIPYRRSQIHLHKIFLARFFFFFLHIFSDFSWTICAAKTRNCFLKTLFPAAQRSTRAFGRVFDPRTVCYQWFYLIYSSCSPFFPREKDGKTNVTVRLARNPTRFWVKMFNFEKKIVKMSTVCLSFMFKLASENRYSIVITRFCALNFYRICQRI